METCSWMIFRLRYVSYWWFLMYCWQFGFVFAMLSNWLQNHVKPIRVRIIVVLFTTSQFVGFRCLFAHFAPVRCVFPRFCPVRCVFRAFGPSGTFSCAFRSSFTYRENTLLYSSAFPRYLHRFLGLIDFGRHLYKLRFIAMFGPCEGNAYYIVLLFFRFALGWTC